MNIKLKRIYEPKEKADGFRILVDRLWPRGITKEEAHLDVWMKDIAPSSALRKWFAHDPIKWNEFRTKYKAELRQSKNIEDLLALLQQHKTITLVYAATDTEHNHAIVIKEFLEQHKK
jgi:uncharacterized protein YeaO (DUF488 family)